jgi:sugar (pentulose or hexulose) kinase
MAVTGVRGAIAGFDANLRPVTPGYPDFDPAAVAPARSLLELHGDALLERTGCPAFPLAGLPKMLLHTGDRRIRWWGGPQELALWRATGRIVMSTGSALRFGILKADGRSLDEPLLVELGIDPSAVPELVMVGCQAGTLKEAACEELSLPPDTIVVAAPGDMPASLLAAGCCEPRRSFVNLGTTTVCAALICGTELPPRVTREVLPGGRRCAETGSGAGVATLEWLAGLLGVHPGGLDSLALKANGVKPTVQPALIDPWGGDAGGAVTNIHPRTGRADLALAVLEAVADAAVDALRQLEAAIGSVTEIVLGGGGARSKLICEHFARSSGRAVRIERGRELAAEGAALVAAASIGLRFEGTSRVEGGEGG